jgi:PAS domain S-box-containing protein
MNRPKQTAQAASRNKPVRRKGAENLQRRVEALATHDLPILLQTIVDRAVGLLDAYGGGLYLCDAKLRQVRLHLATKTMHDYTGAVLKYGEGLAGTVAQSGEPLIIDDYQKWPGRAAVFAKDEVFRAVLGVPMVWNGQVIGVIDVFRKTARVPFNVDDEALLAMFANHAAIATANAQLVEGLQGELAERMHNQQVLAENELKYRALFNTANEAILLMEGDRLIDCNPMAEMTFRMPKEKVLGLPLRALSPVSQPDGSSSKAVLARKFKAALHEEAQSFEWQFQRGDGALAEAEVSLNRIDLNGKPFLQVIVHDITARKQAENALREAETRYRTLIEQVAAVIYMDAKDRPSTTLYISPQVTALSGYSPEQWIADPDLWWRLIHPDDLPRIREAHRLSNATGKPFNVEYRLARADGSILWIHDQAILLKGIPGEPERWHGLMVDITERKQAETALRDSQQMLRTIIDTIPVRVYWKDRESKYLGCNQAFASDAGFKTPEEIIGKDDSQTGWKDRAELFQVEDRAMIASGAAQIDQEEPQTAPDGRPVWLRRSKIPLLDGEGRVKGVLGTYENITARKRGEKALVESEEKYRNLVELASDGIVITQGGLIKYANPTLASMAGVPVEAMIGQPFTRFADPDFLPKAAALYEQQKTQAKLHRSLESAVLRADGSRILVEVNLAEVQFEEKPALLALVRDVTDRQIIERALRESEEKFRSVIEQASDGFVLIDEAGMVIEWNHAQEQIWGMSRAEAVGKPFWEVQYELADPEKRTPGQLEYFRKAALEALKTGQSPLFNQPIEDTFIRRTGETISLAQTIFPVKTEQGHRLASLSRDISARKEAEATLQRQVKELTVIQSAARACTESDKMDELIERITEIIGESLYPDNFGVILVDGGGKLMRSHPSYRLGKVKEQGSTVFARGEGISSYVLETGQAYRVADVRQEPRYLGVTSGICSELCVPLVVGGRAIGVVNAESRQPDFFSPDDERLLSTIAVQMGTAIEKIKLLDVERRQRQVEETLRQAVSNVSSSLETRQVLDSILGSLKKVVPFDSASVMLLEGDGLRVVALQSPDHPEQFIGTFYPTRNAFLEQVLETRSVMILPDASQDRRFEGWGGEEPVRGWMGVPLLVRDRMIGFITLESLQVSAYSEEHATLVQIFSQQAAVAIENARLYEQAVQAADRRAILHQASQEIARASQDPEGIYQAVHHAAAQVMPAETFVISLLNEAGQEVIGVYLFDQGKRWPGLHLPLGESLSGQVIASGKSVIVNQLAAETRVTSVNFGEGQDVASILAVPMRLGQKVIGMLSAQSYTPSAYTEDDQSLLEMLAAHAAVAIDNSRLYAETQRRLKELEVINRISTTLRAAQTVEEMLPLLLDETLQVLDSEAGSIWLFEPAKG